MSLLCHLFDSVHKTINMAKNNIMTSETLKQISEMGNDGCCTDFAMDNISQKTQASVGFIVPNWAHEALMQIPPWFLGA